MSYVLRSTSSQFKQAWLESGCVYGHRKLTLDMRDLGERCGKHRVARLLQINTINSTELVPCLNRVGGATVK